MVDLKRGRETERKTRMAGRQTATSTSSLWHLKAHSTSIGRNEAQIWIRSKEACSAGHTFRARILEAVLWCRLWCFSRKIHRTGAKESCSIPKSGQLCTPVQGKGLRMRIVCSALCDIRSQEEQMVNFFANSEWCSHRKGSHSTHAWIRASGMNSAWAAKRAETAPRPHPSSPSPMHSARWRGFTSRCFFLGSQRFSENSCCDGTLESQTSSLKNTEKQITHLQKNSGLWQITCLHHSPSPEQLPSAGRTCRFSQVCSFPCDQYQWN